MTTHEKEAFGARLRSLGHTCPDSDAHCAACAAIKLPRRTPREDVRIARLRRIGQAHGWTLEHTSHSCSTKSDYWQFVRTAALVRQAQDDEDVDDGDVITIRFSDHAALRHDAEGRGCDIEIRASDRPATSPLWKALDEQMRRGEHRP